MARQKGIIRLAGSVGNMNFFRTKDGDFARQKAEIDIETLLYGPEFANSRKAGKVFGLASTASRLIRSAFSEMITAGSNRNMHNRLLRALQQNAGSAEYLYQLPFHQLRHFDINVNALFSAVCSATHTMEAHVPGQLTVSFPPFEPEKHLLLPPGAQTTHFRLVAGAAIIDCRNNTFQRHLQSTPPLSIDQPLTQPQQLHLSVPPHPGQPLLVALSIVFTHNARNRFIDSVNEHHTPVFITDVVYEPLPVAAPKKTPAKKKNTRTSKMKPGAKKK